MIPKRIHRDLPDDWRWIITDHPRQLTVYLAADVPPDGPLEQHFVRQATRAWRRRHYPGPLVILPIAASGAAWAARKVRQPLTATGVVAGTAMVALGAVTLTDPNGHHHRPPTAEAPRMQPSTPRRDTTPHKPAKPPHPKPDRARPRPSPPRPAAGASAGSVRVDPPRLPVDLPVDVPPVKVTPPQPKPPAALPPPTASTCRLVEIHVGKLVRICL